MAKNIITTKKTMDDVIKLITTKRQETITLPTGRQANKSQSPIAKITNGLIIEILIIEYCLVFVSWLLYLQNIFIFC
jgi:hypothetical protein